MIPGLLSKGHFTKYRKAKRKKKREINADHSLTRKEVDRAKASFELDLIAFFNILQEDVFGALDTGISEGQTPDQIVDAVGELL